MPLRLKAKSFLAVAFWLLAFGFWPSTPGFQLLVFNSWLSIRGSKLFAFSRFRVGWL
jgi:hypothetical protein